MFRSKDYIFRPTTMADALLRAGIQSRPALSREPRMELQGRYEIKQFIPPHRIPA